MILHKMLWAILVNNFSVQMTAHQTEHVTTVQANVHAKIIILETTAQLDSFHFLTN